MQKPNMRESSQSLVKLCFVFLPLTEKLLVIEKKKLPHESSRGQVFSFVTQVSSVQFLVFAINLIWYKSSNSSTKHGPIFLSLQYIKCDLHKNNPETRFCSTRSEFWVELTMRSQEKTEAKLRRDCKYWWQATLSHNTYTANECQQGEMLHRSEISLTVTWHSIKSFCHSSGFSFFFFLTSTWRLTFYLMNTLPGHSVFSKSLSVKVKGQFQSCRFRIRTFI